MKTIEVHVEGWEHERTLKIDRQYNLSFQVAFNNGPICQDRVRALRRRLDEELFRGKLRHDGDDTWLDVELVTPDQAANPLKYLSRLVGLKITEVKGKK